MRVSRWAVVLLASALTTGVVGHAQAQNLTMKAAMRLKMDSAQVLLKAVVTGDYAAIARSADRLSRITDTEIASWQTPGRPEYTNQAMRFLMAVQTLRDAARSRDQRAAGTGYAALVSSCASCHATVTRTRVVRVLP